jgi:hypothetical protein
MNTRIKILFFASNPDHSAPLMLDEEIRSITAQIRMSEYRDIMDLVSCWATRPDDLLQELNIHKPTIVHFSGHGSRVGEIMLTDNNRQHKAVNAAALKALFKTVKDNIRLVILNACYSEVQAAAISEIVDCVIGMNMAIGDPAATAFASSFYRAIGFGRSVAEAFNQGKVALMLEGIPEENTPVLLYRQGIDPTNIHLVETTNNTEGVDSIDSYCSCLIDDLGMWRGLGSFSNKNLKQIYVPHILIDKSQKSKEVSDPSVLESLLEPNTARPSILVEGNPGSGKTMLLRNWAVTLAQSRLQSKSRGYIPIYLPIGWIERVCGKGPWNLSLIELAAQRYPDVNGQASEPLVMALTEAVKSNRVLILLDAADEISQPALPHFLDWWNRLRAASTHCPIVLTSRPLTHTGGVSVIDKLYIRSFNSQQRETFIENWFGGKEQANVSTLRTHLQQSFRLQAPDVAGNPLFLTMMCVELENRGKLSTTPGKLLDQFVRLLLEAWDLERGVQRASCPLDLKLLILESAATHFFELNRVNINERELLDHTRRFLNQRDSSVQASNIIDEIVNTSGLLVKDRSGDYQFCHHLFLEYFVARDKAFGLNENEQTSWLQNIFFDSRYEKVIQFYQELKFEE